MSPIAKPKFKNPRARYDYQGRSVSIAGVGAYVPAKALTNFELEKMVATTDEWITTRTGIKERRIAAKFHRAIDHLVCGLLQQDSSNLGGSGEG